jgi:hypothetical protein
MLSRKIKPDFPALSDTLRVDFSHEAVLAKQSAGGNTCRIPNTNSDWQSNLGLAATIL